MPQNAMVPVPTYGPPTSWVADEIVYSRIKFNSGKFNFYMDPSSRVVAGYDIDTFIADLRTGTRPPKADKKWGPVNKKPPKRTQLDVQVDTTCWVVLELEVDANCRFLSTGPALTTKKDYGDRNQSLRHVPGNPASPPQAAPAADCHIVYFAAVSRDLNEGPHQFNFHLELLWTIDHNDHDQGEKQDKVVALEVILDPDIPNGNGAFC